MMIRKDLKNFFKFAIPKILTPRCHALNFSNKFETEFENTLACLSGARIGSDHE